MSQQQTQALIPMKASALSAMASRFEMEPKVLMDTLKNTVFKGATNEQLAALVIVANEHNLNPFTREIYAFPDKAGGIQAVIGVDGWIRIITTNPRFNGVEFIVTDKECTCIMHVKEREFPVKITEYLDECKRNTEPWRTYPRRMLRHKALIQAGRIAFGLGSLKDEDDVVVAHPASATVRPIFGAAEQLPENVEALPSPEGETGGDAPENVGTTNAEAPSERPTPNLIRGIRGLLKIAGHTEADLLRFLREVRGVDESLSSLEQIKEVQPSELEYASDHWRDVDKLLKAWKAKGAK